MSKTNPGNFFEDFQLGQVIEHATPRTVTEGDRAVYGALYPTRFAIPSSAAFAAVHLDVTAALPLFGLAVLLAWQVERTGSLLGCAFVHAVNNATSLLPLFLLRE